MISAPTLIFMLNFVGVNSVRLITIRNAEGGVPYIVLCNPKRREMMNTTQYDILDSQFDDNIFKQLSALDKLCVGADGWSVESFRSETQKDNGIVLYIMDDERVIALLSGYTAVGEADITSVAVHPNYRRKGLAQKLMEHFEAHLPDDTESIFLEVRESNSDAIALYQKCGFEQLSVRKNFYTDPRENALVMQKNFHKGATV